MAWLELLVHSPSAADIQQLTGKPVGLFRSQKHNDVGNIFRASHAAQRGIGGDPSFLLGIEVAGLDGTQTDDVDRDATLPHLRCRRPAARLTALWELSSIFPVLLYYATFTHDGRWITFNALDARSFPIRLQVLATPFQLDIPSKESDWIEVVSDQHYNDKPRWSPDENRIYFVSDRDGFACLWSQSVEPDTKWPVGPPLPLYHIHQVRRSIQNVGWGLMDIAVAPGKIVLNLSEITGNIWMTKLAEE